MDKTDAADDPPIQDLFVAQGRRHYRIPVIVADSAGNLVAFANCRMDTAADGAREVGLVYRCKGSGSARWEPIQTLFAHDGWQAAVGTATVDRRRGAILLSYYRQAHDPPFGTDKSADGTTPGAFQSVSVDGGRSWNEGELRIRPNARGVSGSSHGSSTGITLTCGRHEARLLAPARIQTAPGEALETLQAHHYNCALYSDDRGKTWQTSEAVQVGTGEGCLVELSDGSIYYNSRAYFGDGKRRVAWSHDGGETFTDFRVDEGLTEPQHGGCNAGMALYPKHLSNDRDIILFSNPAGKKREGMTVRASYDGGTTWPFSRIIYDGPAAYSAMAVAADGTIYVLYENGIDHPYQKISLACFNLEWLNHAGPMT